MLEIASATVEPVLIKLRFELIVLWQVEKVFFCFSPEVPKLLAHGLSYHTLSEVLGKLKGLTLELSLFHFGVPFVELSKLV